MVERREPRRRVRDRADRAVDPRVDRNRTVASAAAREILVEEGLDAVTHVRVAERSGLSRATLYRHWPDVTALRQAAIGFVAATFPHGSPTGTVATEVRTELEGLRVRFMDPEAAKVLVTLIERAEWDADFRNTRSELVQEHLGPLRRSLTAGIQRGELREGLDVSAAVSRLVGPLVFRRFISAEPLSPAFVDGVVRSFLEESATERSLPAR